MAQNRSMMMMSDLPLDLLEEILSRVPASTLGGLRFTCKRWNALFKDQSFTEKHFRQATKQSFLVMLNEFRVFSMKANLDVEVAPPSIQFQGALDLKDSHSNSQQVVNNISQVLHCDGLLLCTTTDYRLVIWNPCLGETRWIQPKTCDTRYLSMYALGYQCNKSSRNYKILRCSERSHNGLSSVVYRVEIYDLSSYSWRALEDVHFNFTALGSGVSLKGNTYCLPLDEADVLCLESTKERFLHLLRFDFTKERFIPLCGPKGLCNVVLSTVKEEQLSVLHQKLVYSTKLMVDIWVTTNININTTDVLLWTKSFAVEVYIHGDFLRPFESFLIDEEKKLVLSCHLNYDHRSDTHSNRVYVTGEEDVFYTDYPRVNLPFETRQRLLLFNYVPSLAQIQQSGDER